MSNVIEVDFAPLGFAQFSKGGDWYACDPGRERSRPVGVVVKGPWPGTTLRPGKVPPDRKFYVDDRPPISERQGRRRV